MMGHAVDFLIRNVRQDLRLAQSRSKTDVQELLLRLSGFPAVDALCKASQPAPAGAEWWLRVRDNFYQGLPVR